MSETSTGPLLNPDDDVLFIDNHRPVLLDGDYSVELSQKVAALGFSAKRQLDFTVKGPRFVLQTGDVASQFPPPNAAGRFETVLPHILLKRSTLPWERSAIAFKLGDPPPWMALLVFEASSLASRTSVVESSTLLTQAVGGSAKPPISSDRYAQMVRESTDAQSEPVLVIDLKRQEVIDLLPTTVEMQLLSAVRSVNQADDCAVVVANRLPVPNARNVVHLVSLEHQFVFDDNNDTNIKHWSHKVKPSHVRLVSLAHWEFMCDQSQGDLRRLLDDMAFGSFSLPTKGVDAGIHLVKAGFVPVLQHLPDGSRTASWYRGPLAVSHRSSVPALPVRRAQELLLRDRQSALVDVSLAAAWKLGQLLALANPKVAKSIHQWKRQIAHLNHATTQRNLNPEHAPLPPKFFAFPASEWFTHALALMHEIPFSHLVPDPALIPAETLVYFHVDSTWISALFDGAFSLGRTSNRELEADRELRRYLPLIGPSSGVLIRSSAVAGWPQLMVDGFSGIATEDDPKGVVQRLRFDRLAPDVLLVLFADSVTSVEVHLHPQGIHFGVDQDDMGFKKIPLNKDQSPVSVIFRNLNLRVIDISNMAGALKATSAHEFSFGMVEGVPRSVFQIEAIT